MVGVAKARPYMVGVAKARAKQRKVYSLTKSNNGHKHSPDGTHLACAVGRKVQVWRTAISNTAKSFSPLVLEQEFAPHSADVTCLTWTDSGFLTGSKDCTAHMQYLKRQAETAEKSTTSLTMVDTLWSPANASVSLLGHKSPIAGVYKLDRPGEEECIFTISEDGSLFEWRFTTDVDAKKGGGARHRKKMDKKVTLEHEWTLVNKHFVQPDSHARVTSVACNGKSLILFGFADGIFSLFELPSGQKLQSLSASKFALESAAMTTDGAWLALGSPTMGQLLVWEWLSETFVLKQQGHFYDMNAVAHSPDGRVMATGGDDAKVKVWSSATNTCFVTFTEHEGAVTAIKFASNTALVTASLDGTVRAFDLIRLRNFRTMTPSNPCQLISLATSSSSDGGEIVCAGASEPPHIFVWSLRTGKLLDVLSGHAGPVACLDFCETKPFLASASWDGTIKVWEPYRTTVAVETLRSSGEASVNQLCVAFRPDGKELCSTGLDGVLAFWNVEDSTLKATLDCKRDLGVAGGDARINACFKSACYSADGRVLLAGGKSRWVFAYDCERSLLLKKFQLALPPRKNGDDLDADFDQDGDADDARRKRHRETDALPGATRGRDAGKREVAENRFEVSCVRFSPTGRCWTATTNRGLMTFSLDTGASFDPVDLEPNCTPQTARAACGAGDYAKSVRQAVALGEPSLVFEIMNAVPLETLSLVCRSLPKHRLAYVLDSIAKMLEQTPYLEYDLAWAQTLLSCVSATDVERYRTSLLPALRALHRAVSRHEKFLARVCDDNMYDLDVIVQTSGT